MAHERSGERSKPKLLIAGLALSIAVVLGLAAIAYVGATADPATKASGDTRTNAIADPSVRITPNQTSR